MVTRCSDGLAAMPRAANKKAARRRLRWMVMGFPVSVLGAGSSVLVLRGLNRHLCEGENSGARARAVALGAVSAGVGSVRLQASWRHLVPPERGISVTGPCPPSTI